MKRERLLNQLQHNSLLLKKFFLKSFAYTWFYLFIRYSGVVITKYMASFALNSNLTLSFLVLGSSSGPDDLSVSLSSKLSLRLKRPVMLGYNAKEADSEAVAKVVEAIIKEVKERPECF